jgi:hypothetical protein
MSEREPYLERMKSSFLSLARAADVMTRDASPKVRPFLRVAFVGSVSLMFIVMVPFFPLIWWRQGAWFKKHKQDLTPVSALEDSARHVWAAASPQSAVDAIREVFDGCRSTPEGIVVEPFGRFEWANCSDALANLLYRFETQLGHWDKALDVAELLAAANRDSEAIFPKWILSRAKCLVRLGRESEALALLMANRDTYNAKAPVNQYLEEVRAGRG